MKMFPEISVLVTAVGNMGVGEQIVKSLRLSALNVSIVGIDISAFNIVHENLDFFYEVSSRDEDEKMRCISKIISDHAIKMVFVGCENDYMFFHRHRSYFESKSVYLAINSDFLSSFAFDKQKTYCYLMEKGVCIPRFWKIDTPDDCNRIQIFPVVIKPNRNASGSRNVYIAFNQTEAWHLASYMLSRKIDIVAQEYVGDADSEYTISVTSNLAGEVLGNIIIKRNFDASITYRDKIRKGNRVYVVASGITQGMALHDEKIEKQVISIAQCLDSRFSVNIQGMFVNGKFMLIEVHPTLTGSVYIRALAGYNEPANLIKRELLNEKTTYKYDDVQIVRRLTCEAVKYRKEGDR